MVDFIIQSILERGFHFRWVWQKRGFIIHSWSHDTKTIPFPPRDKERWIEQWNQIGSKTSEPSLVSQEQSIRDSDFALERDIRYLRTWIIKWYKSSSYYVFDYQKPHLYWKIGYFRWISIGISQHWSWSYEWCVIVFSCSKIDLIFHIIYHR